LTWLARDAADVTALAALTIPLHGEIAAGTLRAI
jgi:hypothetical protein